MLYTRRFAATLAVTLAVAFSFAGQAKAEPEEINPFGSVYVDSSGSYNAVGELGLGGLDQIYMNRNQLLVRLTGCEYRARVTNDNAWNDGFCDNGAGNPRHWTGSAMSFIESLVNDKLLGATTNPIDLASQLGVTIPPQYWVDYDASPYRGGSGAGGVNTAEPVFRNYLDLLFKRLLDGDRTTPLDYDIHTFRYVDSYNPAFTAPSFVGAGISVNPTTFDTNGDGVEGGWEPFRLLAPTCIPDLVFLGPDICLNLNIVNTSDTFVYYVTGPWGGGVTAPNSGGVTEVNNVGAPMIDFTPFDPANQAGTSHLFLASKPEFDFTFDAELQGCARTLKTTPGNCNASPYRDDDDGLFAEIKLVNFQVDLLFEPPFTDAAYGTSQEVEGATPQDYRFSYSRNISDIPETGSAGFTTWTCADGSQLTGVTNESSPLYDAKCDLSRWLKFYGTATVPELTLGISLRIVSSYDSGPVISIPNHMVNVTAPVISLGFDIKVIEFSGQFSYILTGGQFCNDDYDGAGPYPAEARQGQDYMGVFYDQTDNPYNCATVTGSGPSKFDDVTYKKSTQFVSTISFLRAEFLGQFEDFFDPNTNPGFFLGPTIVPGLDDLNDTVAEATGFDWPLAGSSVADSTDAVWLALGLGSDVELAADMVAPLGTTEYATKGAAAAPLVSGQGDAVAEFWADPWGVLMPFSGGVGIYWTHGTSSTGANAEVASCVTADPAYTGYVDGVVSLSGDVASQSDDPYVTRPLPSLNLSWAGSGDTHGAWQSATDQTVWDGPEYDSMLLHLRIPDVNGMHPFVGPWELRNAARVGGGGDRLVPVSDPANATTDETYAIGLAIHQNLLSKLLYEFVVDGLLCIDIDPDAPYQDALDSLLGSILTTDTMGLFVPHLTKQYGGENMALRIVPLLKDPSSLYLAIGQTYQSAISQYTRSFSGGSAVAATSANPIPRIIVGGENQYDSLKKRFRGQIATRSLIANTCGASGADPLTDPSCGLWPDLSIIIPHLAMEFYVNDSNGGTVSPPVRRRAFALDVGINVGLNIDVIKNPVQTSGASAIYNPNLLFGDAITNSRPIYGGTDFPIGCDDNVPGQGCLIRDVPSRLVIFLGGLLDPELNAVLVYDEMPSVLTDIAGTTLYDSATGGCVDPTGSANTTCPGGTGPSVVSAYEDAISNLLGLILSGEISFFAEIGFDPAAYLDLPVILTIPYIGPSFVWNNDQELGTNAAQGFSSAGGYGATNLGCLNNGSGTCPDPVFGNTTASAITRDVSDGDASGFGDYLVVALGVDLSYLETNFLLRLIDSFVEPLALTGNDSGLDLGYDYCDGDLDRDSNATTWGGSNPVTDITCVSESFRSRLSDVLGSLGLGGAPGFGPAADGNFPPGYQSPETIIKGVRKAHGFETIIEYEGWHPTVDPSELVYSYRVDGGFWTPFVPATTARIPGLFEGRHVFEVRAMDPDKNVEYTPERLVFVVDSVAPQVKILGDRVQSGIPTFVADVYDAQTRAEDVRIAWRLDDGEWSQYSYDKEMVLDAAPGQHVLTVRAMDESGNVGEQVLTIAVEDGGFGCSSTTTGGSGLLDLALILLVPALIAGRRRGTA